MLRVGVIVFTIAFGCIVSGLIGRRIFSEFSDKPPTTVVGGYYFGAVWVVRLGVPVAGIGLLMILVGAALEA